MHIVTILCLRVLFQIFICGLSPHRHVLTSIIRLHIQIRCRGHSNYIRSFFDSSCFYKFKAVINLFRGGGSAPHNPWPELRPRPYVSTVQTSAYWVNKSVYKDENKSRNNFSEHLHFGGGRHILVYFFVSPTYCNISKNRRFFLTA